MQARKCYSAIISYEWDTQEKVSINGIAVSQLQVCHPEVR